MNPFDKELALREQGEQQPTAARFAKPELAPSNPFQAELSRRSEDVDTRGWGQWAYDSVVGREDPQYKGLPTVDEALTEEGKRQGRFFTSPEQRHIRASVPFAVSDEQYGDVMRKALGERYVNTETDKYGNKIVVYKGDDGHEKRAYVNRPGLDSEDISRGLMQSVPYIVGGAAAGSAKLGLAARSLLQGLTGTATSVGQDVAATQFGSEQGIDPARALATGVFSAGAEVAAPAIASAWRRFVTEPSLYNASKGELTEKGAQLAIQLGINPNEIKGKLAQEFAKTYAVSGDAALAGRQVAQSELGIESTIGQRTKDWDRLFEEEAMRKGLRGEGAKQVMKEFDERQKAQVANALIGNAEEAGAGNVPGQKGIIASLNPDREVGFMRPQDVGGAIQEGLQSAKGTAKNVEREAWKDLRGIMAEQQALDEFLPSFLAPAIRDSGVDPQLTPNAYRMVDLLRQYQTGQLAQDSVLEHFGHTARPTVDEIRRRLLGFMDNAAPGSPDKRAAASLYRAYDDWLGASAEAHLLSGHPDAANAIRNARGISREIKDLFQPRGNEKAAGNIISRIMDKADSPEAVVNAIVGKGAKGDLPVGSVGAFSRIKSILDQYGGLEGNAVWNDIRSAYLMRAVKGPTGEILNPKPLLTSLQTMMNKQESLLRVLYTPQEIGQMRKFMRSLEQITYNPPNPSGSAYGVIQGIKDIFSTILNTIPGVEKIKIPVQIAMKMTGVPSARDIMAKRAAERVTKAGLPDAVVPVLGGYGGAAGEQFYKSRHQ